MTAGEFFKNQSITDESRFVIDKNKRNYTAYEVCKFAEAYHKAKLKLLGISDVIISPDRINNYGRHQYNRGNLELSIVKFQDWND